MRVRAVVEFDLKFDEDLPSIEELVSYHKKYNCFPYPTPERSIAYEIKNLLEDEHRGLAEYGSSIVSVAETLP
jgi:hypothetical protein